MTDRISIFKRPIGIDVLTAAEARIRTTLTGFESVCVCYSGGKDSTVLLHLVGEEARRQKRRFSVLFVDWEAQFKLTIQHVSELLKLYEDVADPIWVTLPLTTVNGVSQIEPEWTCWDPAKKDLWVREMPVGSISDTKAFPFYQPGMTFEHFVASFGSWFGGKDGVSLLGLRAGESLNRFRALFDMGKETWESYRWTTKTSDGHYTAYPLYDWRTEDIWTYLGKYRKPYNKLYDRMHQAGLTPHQMRICEPYGNEQRIGLWLFHIIEPETWSKIAGRVSGANSGALYSKEKGNVTGNRVISCPPGHTWKSYAHFLLDTMPPKTANHYKNKIAVYLKWYKDRGTPELPDQADGDTGSEDVGSWRRICKCLLKNDYWAKTLSFGINKTGAYEKYLERMKQKRAEWGIMS